MELKTLYDLVIFRELCLSNRKKLLKEEIKEVIEVSRMLRNSMSIEDFSNLLKQVILNTGIFTYLKTRKKYKLLINNIKHLYGDTPRVKDLVHESMLEVYEIQPYFIGFLMGSYLTEPIKLNYDYTFIPELKAYLQENIYDTLSREVTTL